MFYKGLIVVGYKKAQVWDSVWEDLDMGEQHLLDVSTIFCYYSEHICLPLTVIPNINHVTP